MAQDRDITRKNHYLPQSYLSHFEDDDEKVLRSFVGPDGRLHQKAFPPTSTGYEMDLYTFLPDGFTPGRGPSDHIEHKVLDSIDDQGIDAVRKILRFSPSHLSDEETSHLAAYLNSFLVRNPRALLEREAEANEAGRGVMRRLRRDWGPVPEGEFDVLSIVDIEASSKNMLRRRMMEGLQDQEAIEFLKGFTYIKASVDEDSSDRFVTGDEPVVINFGKAWPPVDWFTFALDPKNLLIAHRFTEPVSRELLAGFCLTHNVQLLRQCQYVYSRDSLDDQGFVKTRRAAEEFLKKQESWPRSGSSKEQAVP